MELDVRGLPHHERPPAIFSKLAQLKEKETLTLLVEIEPLPMYRMLEQRGYEAKGEKMQDCWKISIRKKA